MRLEDLDEAFHRNMEEVRQFRTKFGADHSGADLSGRDLSGQDLMGMRFNRANLASANLDGAILIRASIVCAVIERTNARRANMDRLYAHAMSVVSSDWSGVQLSGSPDCTGSLFHGVKLVGANLSGSNLAGTTFYQCDLTDADLTDAVLDHAVFNECILNGARFNRAKMGGAMFARSAAKRCDLSNVVGAGLTIDRMTGVCDWSAAGARLEGATVKHTNMVGSRWDGADLNGASFDGVDLGVSSLSGASLLRARIAGCHGSQVDFTYADLSSGLITDCRFLSPSFQQAKLENTFVYNTVIERGIFGLISGRGLLVRDSSLADADFEDAYLYRAAFTGDPVTGMILDRANFMGANLIQATIAASMKEASLKFARAAYARLNQTDLTDADLEGFACYRASALKTIWPGQPPKDLLVAVESEELGST